MLIKATIPELAIEALYKGILSRFAWLDKMQRRPAFFAPEEHSLRRHLLTIVTDNGFGQATTLAQFREIVTLP